MRLGGFLGWLPLNVWVVIEIPQEIRDEFARIVAENEAASNGRGE
ncbi:MAG: hypothetical protein WB661_08175 [Candidatus Bathyarchaeia archaeon]